MFNVSIYAPYHNTWFNEIAGQRTELQPQTADPDELEHEQCKTSVVLCTRLHAVNRFCQRILTWACWECYATRTKVSLAVVEEINVV